MTVGLGVAVLCGCVRTPDSVSIWLAFCAPSCVEIPEQKPIPRGTTVGYAAVGTDDHGSWVLSADWRSSNPAVATVDQDGHVTGVELGDVMIYATAAGHTGIRPLTVGCPELLSHIKVIPGPTVNLTPGQSVQLTAEIFDTGGQSANCTSVAWSVDNPAVASVDPAGRVTAEGAGYALVQGYAAASYAPTDVVGVSVAGTPAPGARFARISGQCGLDAAGVVTCWKTADRPTMVPAAARFVELADGTHTCALDDGGAAWCWGDNKYGQIGIEPIITGKTFPTPARVLGDHAFVQIAVGAYHTCAIDDAGAAWCWGADDSGQSGQGEPHGANLAAPARVAGGIRFASISAGLEATCGLAVGGQAYCWGRGSYGILGNITTPEIASKPTAVLQAGHPYVSLSLTNQHVCAVDTDGDVWCWGQNGYGQVGEAVSALQAVPVRVSPAAHFATVSAGTYESCALDAGGGAWCWGENDEGALGDGTHESSSIPVLVAGGHHFTALAAGSECALSDGDEAYCWGRNVLTSLPNGDVFRAGSSSVPIPVPARSD